MWAGLALTAVATLYPFLDRTTTHVLADHLRAGYPSYGPSRIDEGVTLYLAVLSVIGGLGILAWAAVMWAVRSGRAWAAGAATAVLSIAVLVALAGLTVKDTSGDVGLAPLMGWLQVLPCVAGVVAVVQLWRTRQ